jgi:hypothetical protein
VPWSAKRAAGRQRDRRQRDDTAFNLAPVQGPPWQAGWDLCPNALTIPSYRPRRRRHRTTRVHQPGDGREGHLMVDVLLAHSAKFYTEVMPGSTNALHAQWIAGHILSRGLDKISSRDIGRVYHELRYADKGTRDEEIAKIMGVLENFDWVAPIRRRGERWPTKWSVNPAVHEKFTPHAARERQERADKIRRIRKARLRLGLEGSEGDKEDDQLS